MENSGARPKAQKRLYRAALEERVIRFLGAPPRASGALMLAGLGLLLIALSYLAGVASTTSLPPCQAASCPQFSGIERGYLFAPNWSLTGLAIWPIMYFALASYVAQLGCVFRAIDESPMAWLRSGDGSVTQTWNHELRWLARFAIFVLLVALAVSWAEWWTNSGAILLAHAPWERAERDWSVAMSGRGAIREWGAAAFSFLAFTYQSVVIAMLFVFAAVSALATHAVGVHGSGERTPALLIDLGSNDPNNRGGFERFVLAIDYMIIFVFCAYANFFATRLQNAFMRERDPHRSLLQFIQQDIGFDPANQKIRDLFAAEAWDFSSAAVAIGSILVLFFSFFFFNASLRHAAVQARIRSDHALTTAAVQQRLGAYHLDIAKCQERLARINVWPLGYSDILPTLAFLVICMTTIIFYRLGVLLIFGWIAGWVLSRATASLVKRSS